MEQGVVCGKVFNMNLFNFYKIIEEQSDLKAVKIEMSKDTSERVDTEIKKAFQGSQETVTTISGIKPIDANAFKRILQNEYIRNDADGNSNRLVEAIVERLDSMPSLIVELDLRDAKFIVGDELYPQS